MNRKIMGVAVAGMALGFVAACNVEQPDPGCRVPHGFTNQMLVKLTPKEGQTPTGSCAAKLTEVVGIDEYLPPESTTAVVAIRPQTLGRFYLAGNGDGEANAVGTYQSVEVPEGGVCTATDFEPATWTTDEQPPEPLPDGGVPTLPDGGMVPPTPAESYVYDFQNVEIYSTAEIPGTQMRGDLTYTGPDGCTTEFDALGVYPPVSCENLDGEPDDRLCDTTAEATPEEAEAFIVPGCRVLIPGILNECLNPTFDMVCDPDTLSCFPREFGALKAAAE